MIREPFPVLRILSAVARIAGFLGMLVGPLYGVYQGVIEPALPGHHFAESDGLQLVVGLLCGLVGIIALVIGEGAHAWLNAQDEWRDTGYPT